VVASVVYSLPFVVQPLQNAFEAIGERPLEAAATLRASPLDAFFSVAVPLAGPASSPRRYWASPTPSASSASC
jgi:molybdate transport system permease protein